MDSYGLILNEHQTVIEISMSHISWYPFGVTDF